MIKILNSSLQRLGVIKGTISCSCLEELNGEYTLEFEAMLDSKLNSLIDENSVYELDGELFDTAYMKKASKEDGSFLLTVQTEHISYQLNNPEYNLDPFVVNGTPTEVLTTILADTGFIVGTVDVEYPEDFNGTYTSGEEIKSRRGILMDFVAYMYGEIEFSGNSISVLQHRGSLTLKPIINNRNVKNISKEVNKRQLDEDGNPTITYTCTPIDIPGDTYTIGDETQLVQNELGIRLQLRVVSKTYDPYDPTKITLQFSNYVNGLAQNMYRVEQGAVIKDKFYNGTRIGPTYGFENISSDHLARSYFTADDIRFQTGDGNTDLENVTWTDKLWMEKTPADTGANPPTEASMDLIFKGTLHSDVIITPNLYADNAAISNLTVSTVLTHTKIQNYLNNKKDPVKYIKIKGEIIQFIEEKVFSNDMLYVSSLINNNNNWTHLPPYTLVFYKEINISQVDGTITYIGEAGGPGIPPWMAYYAGYIYSEGSTSTEYYMLTGYDQQLTYYDVYETVTKISYIPSILNNGVFDYGYMSRFYKEISINKATGEITYSTSVISKVEIALIDGYIYKEGETSDKYYVLKENKENKIYYDLMGVSQPSDNDKEQWVNGEGKLCYWKDSTNTIMTTDPTSNPVYIYRYMQKPNIKMEMSFFGASNTPEIKMGLGTGVGENGKASILKDTDGLKIKYTTTDGTLQELINGDNGILISGCESRKTNVRNIWEGTQAEWDAIDPKIADTVYLIHS